MMNLNLTVVAGIVGLILAEKADPHLLFVGSSNLVGVSILARACLLDLGC